MNFKNKNILLAAFLAGGMITAQADNVKVRFTTALANGSELTFTVPTAATLTVDWGDGVKAQAKGGAVTGKLKGDTVTVEGNTNMTAFYCPNQQIEWIDVSAAPTLVALDCSNNLITKLDVSENSDMQELDCSGNALTSLGLVRAKALRYLDCANNKLKGLALISNSELETLNISGNDVSSLSLSGKDRLRSIWAEGNNLKRLNLNENAPIQSIVCPDNNLEEINLTDNTDLQDLWIEGNEIENAELAKYGNLKTLNVAGNEISALQLSENITTGNRAQYVNFSDNHLPTNTFGDINIANTYICGNQTVKLDFDSLRVSTYKNFKELTSNAKGKNVGEVSFFNSKDDAQLKSGRNAKTSDFASVMGRVKFWNPFDSVYAKITSESYPGLEVRTSSFVVYDPDAKVNGIEDIKLGNEDIRADVSKRTLTLASKKAQNVKVISAEGVIVWQGEVSERPVSVSLTPGIYIVGKKKIIIS